MKGTYALGAVTGILLVTAACTSSKPPIAKADLASRVKTQLTATVGQAPDSVTCPNDLATSVGATTRCSLTSGSATYGVTVTVTAVHSDSSVDFTIKVDQTPLSG